MADLLTAIGFVGTVLGIVGFAQSNLPGSVAQGTAVQIKTGIPGPNEGASDLGGGVQNVYGFDRFNRFIGQSGEANVAEGNAVNFVIDQSSPNTQADYVGLAATNDGLCISWISVRQNDGSPGGAWTGDIGSNCGQRWHMGNQRAGDIDGREYVPRCAWLDGDFTDGTQSASLKFRTRAYGEEAQDTVNNGRSCGSTIFGRDRGPIAGQPAKRAADVERPQWIVDRLMISDIAGQDAEILCSSETSWGPNFIGTDGKFCDMSTKTLYTLCSVEEVDGCVEFREEAKVITKRSNVARREMNATHKAYKSVTYNHL